MSPRFLQAWVAAAAMLAACQSEAPAKDGASVQSSSRPFTVAEVASFSSPWAMDFLPGSGVPLTNLALLTEREGKLWLVDVRNGSKREVSGVPEAHVAGQGGLGDVVVHPDFAGNRRVYLSYVEEGEGGTSGAV